VKSHNSGFKIMPPLRSALYIFKRKKGKKESRVIFGGFKRSQAFLKKYYPNHLIFLIAEFLLRVEIFYKTRRA